MQEEVARLLRGRSVLCALSGGVDSVVLLRLMLDCGLAVRAAHVEHGIRGGESLRDCEFVQALCRDWGVELEVAHLDVPGEARREKRGLEETARALRYDFLRRQREKWGLDLIATAHHMNDQAETLLMHLARGCGPAGLEGMRQEENGLVRPLLGFTRAQIEQYARAHGLPYVQDSSNEDTAYTRNYVRREVLPRLETVNPRAVEALWRLSQQMRGQNDYVRRQAEEVLRERMEGAFLGDLSDLHPGLRGEVLRLYLARLGLPCADSGGIARLERLTAMGAGRRVSLGKELFERDTNGIRRVIMEPSEPVRCRLHGGVNDTPLGRFVLTLCGVPEQLDLGPRTQLMDAANWDGELIVRTRRPGDKVRLMGGGSRLLSDVMTDRKVPRALRSRVPLIERDGEILWICGIAPCAPCAVAPGSERALKIQYIEPKE